MSDWNALAQSVFDEFDADKDGTLTPEELKAFFESLVAKGFASGEYEAWFATIDKDGDGTVNHAEMAVFLESINYTAWKKTDTSQLKAVHITEAGIDKQHRPLTSLWS